MYENQSSVGGRSWVQHGLFHAYDAAIEFNVYVMDVAGAESLYRQWGAIWQYEYSDVRILDKVKGLTSHIDESVALRVECFICPVAPSDEVMEYRFMAWRDVDPLGSSEWRGSRLS